MLKKANLGRARIVAGALGVSLLAVGAGVGAWAAQPVRTVFAVSPWVSFTTSERIVVRVPEGTSLREAKSSVSQAATAPPTTC